MGKKSRRQKSAPLPPFVRRPFADLVGETDLVAMREFVPAASAPITIKDRPEVSVELCTLLPGAVPAMVMQDGRVAVALQVQHNYTDPSRDLAAVLLQALDGEPGQVVSLVGSPGEGPRLQDLVTNDSLEVTVHDGFDFWLAGVEDPDGSMAAALEQANGAISPTAKLDSVPSAYWTDVSSKEYLRFALPYDEDQALDALAKLHVAGVDSLVDGGRLVGMFRAHGILVPVWDLLPGTGAAALEQPALEFWDRLAETLAAAAPLNSAERAARAGLANRQLTLR